MNEKEKRDLELLYDANNDIELSREREKAKRLCYKYNNLETSKIQEKENLLKILLGKVEDKILIEPNFYCDYGYNIEVRKKFLYEP